MKRLLQFAAPLLVMIFAIACSKEYSTETGMNAAGIATGSLKDSVGNCLPVTVAGIYRVDSTLNNTHTVTVQVDITTPGQYIIFTDTINGFWFSDSGFATATGLQSITLKGSGKPVLPIPSEFELQFGVSSCLFSVNVEGNVSSGTPNDADTAWQFNADSMHFNGPVDSALIKTLPTGGNALVIVGGTAASRDSILNINLVLTSSTVTPATYSTANGTATFTFLDDVGNVIYLGNQSNGAALTITVTSYDAATKIMEATFSGTVKDNAGAAKNISSGSLKLQVN